MLEVTDLASAWGHEGTRTNHGSGIIFITEKPDRQHQLSMQCTTFGLLVDTGRGQATARN